jgi:leader peptidase (prepilin peptidase)/N-methyltransferase
VGDPLDELLRGPGGAACAVVWGLLWGSFFNVAVHRLGSAAAEDESETWLGSARAALASLGRLFRPPSHCPHCRAPIRWYDNLPVAGWLLLRGRCRDCRAPISPRYPLVEAASGALAAAVWYRFVLLEPAPASLQLSRFLVYFFFAGALVVLTLIDLETMLLPLAVTLPAIPAFFLAGRALHDVSTTDALVGLAVGFGALFLLRNGYKLATGRDGLGGGDELLTALVGGLLGWRALPVTLFLGAVCGTLVSVPLVLLRRRARPAPADGEPPLRHVEVPFGPFLAFGAAIYLFFGRALWAWIVAWTLGE